ncbi:helix-turn-helix transcriptional regulator [Paraliobacillus zengyii]|uniref:helix-turn-helix transcriptional regulator n=1 Tax=Paraliobacillus zengyii TaxID=2213194 RepID=UPI000DD3E8C0|nr:hypothetical protein [Paraliobacillus zengyii]
MNNIVAGYRKMAGLTQKEMAQELNVSEGTYRNKEKGNSFFKQNEIDKFYNLVKKTNSKITIDDIFFTYKPTQKDAKERGGLIDKHKAK